MSTKNIEQSSVVKAEDTLPKFPTSVEHYPRLLSQAPDDGVPNTMCFYSLDGSVFQGIILEELQDSFLVGAAARMRMNAERQVTSEEISSQPMMRVFKTSIHYMVVPTDLTVYHYFAFVEKFGYNKLPYYFTDNRKAYITSVRNDSRYNAPMDLTPRETAPDTPGDTKHSFTPHQQSESIH